MSAGKASARLSHDQFKELLVTYSRTKKIVDNATNDLKVHLADEKKKLSVAGKTLSAHMAAEQIDDVVKLPEQGGTLQMVTRETTPKLSAAAYGAVESAMNGFVAPDTQGDFMASINENLLRSTTQKTSLKHSSK